MISFTLNNRHRKTLLAIMADPVARNIHWSDVEKLLIAMGAERIEGRGSRVRFSLGGHIATFHRPHPAKEAKPYQIRDVRSLIMLFGDKK